MVSAAWITYGQVENVKGRMFHRRTDARAMPRRGTIGCMLVWGTVTRKA